MFSSKVHFISLTPSCTSGNWMNTKTSSNKSPLLPVVKRRMVKSVNLHFVVVGGGIINGSSCQWLSSPMSAVMHVQQRPLTCEEASGRCTASCANIVMYVCGGIKRITTHAFYCHSVSVTLTVKNQDHQRHQTIHASACRKEKGIIALVPLKPDDLEVEHMEGWIEEFSCLQVFLPHVVFIKSLFVLNSLTVWVCLLPPSRTDRLYHQFCPT